MLSLRAARLTMLLSSIALSLALSAQEQPAQPVSNRVISGVNSAPLAAPSEATAGAPSAGTPAASTAATAPGSTASAPLTSTPPAATQPATQQPATPAAATSPAASGPLPAPLPASAEGTAAPDSGAAAPLAASPAPTSAATEPTSVAVQGAATDPAAAALTPPLGTTAAAAATAPGATPLPASPPANGELEALPRNPAGSTPAPAEQETPDGRPVPPAPTELRLLGQTVQWGTRTRLTWSSGNSFIGAPMEVPVIVVAGSRPGPVLCLTGAIHGDELNGIEVIRRIMASLDPKDLTGAVVGVPIVNMAGFARGSRYLPDRRDLNRFFPGNPNGSSASRIAYSFFESVARHCTAIVDFHTGSFDRTNLPQVRGDMRIDAVVQLTRAFGATSVLHTPGAPGMLRRAATDIGIPAVTFEIGAPVRLQPEEIEAGVTAMETLLGKLGISQSMRLWREPQPIFYESRWVRAIRAGMLFSDVNLGDRVRRGQRLGRIVDPLGDTTVELISPVRGRVLGMALNQVVLPGYAAYHIGEEASEAQVVRDAETPADLAPVPETELMDESVSADAEEGSTEQVEDYGAEENPGGG